MKRRDQLTRAELERFTLHMRCEDCDFLYALAPVTADTRSGQAWYSSDRDFCPKCGSSSVMFAKKEK